MNKIDLYCRIVIYFIYIKKIPYKTFFINIWNFNKYYKGQIKISQSQCNYGFYKEISDNGKLKATEFLERKKYYRSNLILI